MRIRGPLATLLAVLVAGAAAVATNYVMAARPAPAPTTATLGLSSGSSAGGEGCGPAPGAGAAAPDAGTGPTPGPKYEGRSSGGEVAVALTREGDAIAARVGDGKGIESWMRGTVHGPDLELTGEDGATLTGCVTDGAAFGTVQVAGKSWPFAAAVPEPEPAPSGNAPADAGGWS